MSIALAVADKPLVRELLASGEIAVEYLETSGPLVVSAVSTFAPPMLLHNSVWDWSLADPSALTETVVVETTQKALDMTRAPWLSIHLGFSTAHVQFDHGMQPRSALLSRQQAFDNTCHTITELAQTISVPLIIENLDYNLSGAYEYICEPSFIADVVRKTGVGLLLDIAHARVSASRLGYPFGEYLAVLPLDRVTQIHISSPRWQGNMLVDAHETLLDEDYNILEDVLRRTHPEALTLEYARERNALVEQLVHLSACLRCR
jgi:uncharacterized protein (UPF0276 family)